ncbi:MAG: FAD-dependent oxidoreductase [Planctomycetota bacterium]|jgi:NADPH-dependent 2,4-dienoyl-CoA reductase/sulfur reductase-like enzyme/rhodanese-related sulfurtransferase
MSRRILIVGGVAAGASAATRARRLDEDAEIVVFEKSGYVSFANCGLPYHVGDVIKSRDRLLLMTPERFSRQFRIEARVQREVVEIDRLAKRVRVRNLDSGQESWERYDKLILAPGARPIVPPIDGVEAANVFVLRNVEDMDAIRSWIDSRSPQRAVIVGAGFIGLEGAEVLARRGLQVNLVELQEQVLPPLDADMAAPVAAHLRDKGVALHLGTGLKSLERSGDLVAAATLDGGSRIETDLVLMSIGIRPNSELAAHAGLELGPRGGICVNERLETSDPSILAAGDAAEVVDAVTGKPTMVPLAGPANRHGRLAGQIAVTGEGPPAGRAAGTAVVGVFDLTVATTGLSDKAAQQAGIEHAHVVIRRGHHVGYYPGAEPMTLKLVYEPGTRRVLGAQAVGGAGVDRRIDVIATVIHFGGTVDDLASLDLAYAPQYGAAKDPVHIAAFVADNQDRGLVTQCDPSEVERLRDEGYFIVDVRPPQMHAAGCVPGAINIPLVQLRDRLDEVPADRPVLVHCQVGQTSYNAARILTNLGRKNVVNLSGGYASYVQWKQAAGG